MRQRLSWKLPRTTFEVGERTAVMGILNVTPDSFSDGGEYFSLDQAISRGKQIEQEGADILDIGGASSRPGSVSVPEAEEIQRVIPAIEALATAIRIPISIDTYRAEVARRALEAGAQIVNDISGFRFDNELPRVAGTAKAAVILMHSRGTRDTLHTQGRLEDPVAEVLRGLSKAIDAARLAGIPDDSIAIDPGIGFGKDAPSSLKILGNLAEFSKLGHPLLVGTSRKSFIRFIIQDSPEARVWGTAASVAIAIANGAHMVRVHDVREMRMIADVADAIVKQ